MVIQNTLKHFHLKIDGYSFQEIKINKKIGKGYVK